MNAIFATPQTATTIFMACPWCDEPLPLEDAFAASAIRCGSCATAIDIEPIGATLSGASIEIAA